MKKRQIRKMIKKLKVKIKNEKDEEIKLELLSALITLKKMEINKKWRKKKNKLTIQERRKLLNLESGEENESRRSY